MKATKKFGALVNLASRRNSRQPPDITYLRSKGILVETPSSLAELPAAISRLGDAGLDVLAVSGGDGTVLSALTAILTGHAFERQPILCLTPDGTTNMTAAD
ncbi:MAG: diacylglycerol kinase family protein, partial [Alphaproteobacteria bacterium]